MKRKTANTAASGTEIKHNPSLKMKQLRTYFRGVAYAVIILGCWVITMGISAGADPIFSASPETITSDPNIPSPTPTKAPVSPENLIKMVNRERISHGLPALIVDPILMQTAQTTADIMAGNLMHGHIGDVRGRVSAAGYGAGDLPWATENFVVLPLGADSRILAAWADETHQIPMVDPNYRHVGAGVAVVDDTVYYVLHAAYTSNKIYEPGKNSPQTVAVKNLVSEYMYPVLTVTPRPDGKVIHVVKSGQTLWGIAIAYNTHIRDIQLANNMPQTLEMVNNGQELIIPIPEKLKPTQQPSATLTQMIVITETPTRPAPGRTIEPTTIHSAEEQIMDPDETGSELSTDRWIQFGIAGGISFGLLLILIGVITGKKKNRE